MTQRYFKRMLIEVQDELHLLHVGEMDIWDGADLALLREAERDRAGYSDLAAVLAPRAIEALLRGNAVDVTASLATSAFAVAANAATGLIGHARAHNVKWRCGGMYATAGVIGALFGSTAGTTDGRISPRPGTPVVADWAMGRRRLHRLSLDGWQSVLPPGTHHLP